MFYEFSQVEQKPKAVLELKIGRTFFKELTLFPLRWNFFYGD